MPRSNDDENDAIDAAFLSQPWTQRDLDLLHLMVRDYENARWFRRRAKIWLMWLLSVPAAVLAFWEPLEKLYHRIVGH